ncbi:MAG: hypothetical protein KGI60_04790 [Patescibacteria group bacterium]|nr:hypothetical protein [Patescibacteria group bacterium]
MNPTRSLKWYAAGSLFWIVMKSTTNHPTSTIFLIYFLLSVIALTIGYRLNKVRFHFL